MTASSAHPPGRSSGFLPVRAARFWLPASAVALLIAALVLPLSRGTDGVPSPQVTLRALAHALSGERLVTARLTGIPYGPMRSGAAPPGLVRQRPELLAAAAGAQRAAQADPSPARLHAWGLSQLILGDYDGAVANLQAAAEDAATSGRHYSDLAAALLTRARAFDQPEDLPSALDAAVRARQLGDSPEIRYNHALALETLHLDEQAAAGWTSFIAADAGSAWADEARTRLTALAEKPRAMQWAPGDPVTRDNAFRAREWLHHHALPQWASATISGTAALSGEEAVAETARALRAASGDDHFAAILADLDARGDRRRLVADAHVKYAAALGALRAMDAARMVTLMDSACAALRRAGSSVLTACEVEAAHMRFQERRFDEAAAEAERLIRLAEARRLAAAEVRAWWLRGRVMTVRQRLDEARRSYGRAREIAEDAGEWVTAARMWSQESEMAYAAGDHAAYWRLRLRALDMASRTRDATAAMAAYASSAALLLREDRYRAAGLLAEAAIAPFGETIPSGLQLPIAETNLVAAVQSGNLDEARRWSAALDAQADALGADPRISSLLVNIDLARAQLAAAAGDRAESMRLVTSALERADRMTLVELQVRALALRADLRRQLGEVDAGWEDVRRATALLAERGGRAGINQRSADLSRLRLAAAQLTHATADPRLPHLMSLDRANSALDRRPDEPAGADRVPPGLAIITFVDDGARLGVWAWSDGDASFLPLKTDRSTVIRLGTRLELLASSGDSGPRWHETLRELGRALVDPLEAAIAGAASLAVVHDAATRAIPFGALLDANGRPVSERWAVVRATSVNGVVQAARAAASARSVIAVADPEGGSLAPLPGARAEATAVAGAYPRVEGLLMGWEASVSRLLPAIAASDVVHLAIHAVANPANPARSYLQLAAEENRADGRWYLDEVGGSRFSPHQTIVLAACRTAAGTVDRRDSVPTMAESILRAGAGWVFATLWQLPDSAGRVLFARLHQHLAEGAPPATALQRLQREFAGHASLAAHAAGIELFSRHQP